MKEKSLPLFFKIGKKSFLENWKQFLALIGIGALSICLFMGLITNAESFSQRANKMYSDGEIADIFITADTTKDTNDFERLEDIVFPYGKLDKRFMSFATLNGRNALCGISYTYPKISHASSIIDKSEKHSETNYFCIDQMLTDESAISAKNNVLHVGDTAEVSFDTGYFNIDESVISRLDSFLRPGKNNPLKEEKLILGFEVTAVMQHPENISRAAYSPTLFLASNTVFRNAIRDLLQDRFTNAGVNLIFQSGFKDILNWGDGNPYGSALDFPFPNQFLAKLDNENNIDLVKEKINDYFESKDDNNLLLLQKKDETSTGMSLSIDNTQNYQLSFVFPVVFFIVSLLIILTTFRQIIIKDRSMVGTLKGLGFKNKEIMLYYFVLVSAVITIAFLIGAISAPFIVPLLMEMKLKILYTLPAYTVIYPPLWLIGTFTVFLGVSLLITYLVIHKEINLKPVESMRPLTPKVPKALKNTNVNKKESTILLSMKMALRNMIIDPTKSLMVLIGVLGCTALLCCGYGIEDTIDTGIKTDPFINSGADITLTYMLNVENESVKNDFSFKNANNEYIVNGFQPYTRKAIDITHDSLSYSTYIEVVGDYVSVGSKNQHVYFRYDIPIDGVLISKKAAKKINANIGDYVSFEFLGERIEGKIYMIYDAFYMNGIVISGQSTLLNEPVTAYQGSWTSINNDYIDEAIEHFNNFGYIGSADTKEGWVKIVSDAVSSISLITNAVKVFALALAVIALYNLGLMNFNERVREVATLKVLGFKNREIALSLLIESITLVVLGAAIGVFIGYPFMVLVLSVNEVGMIDYIFTITTLSYAFSVLFTILVGSLINSLLMFKIKKVKMIESLKSIE